MTAKIKKTQSETLSEEKRTSNKSKVKSAIKKLKKLRDKISGKIDVKEKKLKKQKGADGKKKKIKSLKRQISKLLKKEKDVTQDLKKLKRVRDGLKNKADSHQEAVQEVVDREPILDGQEILDEMLESEGALTSGILQEEDDSTKNDIKEKSVDHPAKAAIVYIRKLTDVVTIDSYIKGDKRPTVVKAAVSRKNRLKKRPV